MPVVDILIGLVIAVGLALLGVWCFRRGSDSRWNRWIKLQSFALFALAAVGVAATVDVADAYSASLGRAAGQLLILYLVVTALVVVFRNQQPSR